MGSERNLKPCPFCGLDATLNKGGAYHYVMCLNFKRCRVQPQTCLFRTSHGAINAWNRRADNAK